MPDPMAPEFDGGHPLLRYDHIEPEDMTREQAQAWIDDVRKNFSLTATIPPMYLRVARTGTSGR